MTEYAIIDIGSNSIRYAEEKCGALPDKEIYTTRLGSGLASTGRLSDETMDRSAEVIRALAARAEEGGFVPRAYATSAVRDAENGALFAGRIFSECGVPVEILSGEEEARYAFIGASSGRDVAAMLDIGGASMQIVTPDFGTSFRAGCVRCGDIARKAAHASDCDDRPFEQRAALRDYLDSAVSMPITCEKGLVGAGGTITTLAALEAGLRSFDAEIAEKTVLTPASVEKLIEKLAEAGEKRRLHPLLRERHDVILYGAFILAYALEKLKAEELLISCRDGMEGYLYKVKKDGEQ